MYFISTICTDIFFYRELKSILVWLTMTYPFMSHDKSFVCVYIILDMSVCVFVILKCTMGFLDSFFVSVYNTGYVPAFRVTSDLCVFVILNMSNCFTWNLFCVSHWKGPMISCDTSPTTQALVWLLNELNWPSGVVSKHFVCADYQAPADSHSH